MGVGELDSADILAVLPSADEPGLRWVLERACHLMLSRMGDCTAAWEWPEWPDATGAEGRLFTVLVFLAVTPRLREWHAANDVPADISAATLRSLGRSMALRRLRSGSAGVFEQRWMTGPFRATLLEIGRLQYTPLHLGSGEQWYDTETCARLGPGFRPGDRAVGVHIPEAGPLWPEACDASLRRAGELFSLPRPFGPCRIATCGSWLLDEQLAEYLPGNSNILAFQRRFTLLPGGGDGDGSVFNFVFHRSRPESLDELPQNTTLERAVVAHLRSGRHWRSRTGWLAL